MLLVSGLLKESSEERVQKKRSKAMSESENVRTLENSSFNSATQCFWQHR